MDSAAPAHAVPAGLESYVTARPRTAQQDLRRMLHAAFGLAGIVCLVVAALTAFGSMPWYKRYATDIVLLGLVLGFGPFATFYVRDLRRTQTIEARFPDFLRDIAESARGGMTLPRALESAARGQYGALTPEIQRMSHQVEWGLSFNDAFERFAARTSSPLIRRTVNLIQESRRSGGNVVDILTAAAEDAREIKHIETTRQNQMQAYTTVIYVTFGVFLFVILLLQSQMVPAFAKAAETALEQGAASFGGISLQEVDKVLLGEVFFHSALVQALTGGLIAGLLRRGRPLAGLPAIAIMAFFAWICFRFLAPLLESALEAF